MYYSKILTRVNLNYFVHCCATTVVVESIYIPYTSQIEEKPKDSQFLFTTRRPELSSGIFGGLKILLQVQAATSSTTTCTVYYVE